MSRDYTPADERAANALERIADALEPRESPGPIGIQFRTVGHLGEIWDIKECSLCFALVSEEHVDEHEGWHRGRLS